MRKLNLFSTLVALSLATSPLWATPPAVNGQLPCQFSVSATQKVYFSQGNLQYNKSTGTWSFLEEQYSIVETQGQNVGENYANQDVVTHFGWGTSGWDNTAADATSVHYQPYSTCITEHGTTNNIYQYGPSNANVVGSPTLSYAKSWSNSSSTKNYDWGVYNSSNLGSGWRTLTANEWKYLLNERSGNRYVKATVHSIAGLIILPDGWTQAGSAISATLSADINKQSAAFTSISDEDWTILENEGAVFLPAAGYRYGTTMIEVGTKGLYWSSTAYNQTNAYFLYILSNVVSPTDNDARYGGSSVRLVKNASGGTSTASVTTAPTAKTNLTYIDNVMDQELVVAGTASGGTMMYRYKRATDENYSSYDAAIPTAIAAGDYNIQYMVDGTGCVNDFTPDDNTINVTIAKAPFIPTEVKTVEANTSLKYNGSDKELISVSGDLDDGCSMQYSLDGINWSTAIPTASDISNYTVYYKVVPDDPNYEDFIPVSNFVNVSITKGDYTPSGDYSVTANNLTYTTGSPQTLVSLMGAVTDGTIWYKVGNGEWTTQLPTATNAGNYTVQYKVVPSNSNYEDYIPNPNTINVSIAKGDYTPSGTYSVTANELTYTPGTAQTLVSLSGSVTDGVIWYKLSDGEWTDNINDEILKATNAGNYNVSYKVVPTNPNYEEYTPTSPIAVTIAKGNIDLGGLTLPDAPIAIDYDGTAQTLLNLTPVPDGCTIEYKIGEGDWSTDLPTATNVGDYPVSYRIVPSDPNYKTIEGNVTVSINDYPTISDHSDATTIASVLSGLGDPWMLKVARTIWADGEYNTICLPFDVTAEDFADLNHPLYGYERLKTFRGANVTGTAPDLYIDIFVEDTSAIKAGRPYLITYPADRPAGDIVNPVFQLSSTTTFANSPSAVSANGVTFQGMFAQVHIDPYTAERDEDYIFLGANSQLMWPSSDQTSGDVKMRGFRAYFIIDRAQIPSQAAPRGTRARIVDAPKTATDLENASATFGGSEKIIENGILYIIRNGIRYNAQGQIVK